MKLYKSLILITVSILLITISSCTKEDEETQKDYLTNGQWKVTGVELDPGIELIPGIPIKDVYDLVFTEECSKDDLIIFNTDGTITEDEGAIKCNPDDPQSVTENTWSMNEEETTISATFFGVDTGSAEILILNENVFQFSTTTLPEFVAQLGIENQTVTITMMKQ